MKTIILGFKSADGKGPATLLAGSEVPVTDQARLFSQMKSSRSYPEGITRISFCEYREREVGILLPSQNSEPQPQPIKTEKKKSK